MADLHEQPQLVGLSERWSGAFGSPLRTTVLTSPIVEITIAFKYEAAAGPYRVQDSRHGEVGPSIPLAGCHSS